MPKPPNGGLAGTSPDVAAGLAPKADELLAPVSGGVDGAGRTGTFCVVADDGLGLAKILVGEGAG